jgi:NADPH2:quinone reductase
MRAALIEEFGPPDLIQVVDVPRPKPASGEVLIEIVAAGVNPVDASNRADGSWAGLTPPVILGSDAAGIVAELGDGVDALSVGDPVFYFSDFLGARGGSYAEYQAVPADIVGRKPQSLSFAEAAALPLAAGTAYEAIVRRLSLTAGETVLIYGAAGGVGGYAVQFAAHLGARVLAVARAEHAEYLTGLGAADTIDYTAGNPAELAAERYGLVDAVADFVGNGSLASSLPVVAEGGRLATACELSGDLELAVDRNLTLHGVLVRPDAARLEALAGLAAAGQITPLIRRELPLEQAAEAHREVERGHGRGKIVLRVRPEPYDAHA